MKRAMPWTRRLSIFHIRLGGCGGCCDVVDELLRGRAPGRVSFSECSTPRHADVIIVSGLWSEGLEPYVRRVIALAPDNTEVVAAGGCCLDSGPLSEVLPHLESIAAHLRVSAQVDGCPPDAARLAGEVRNVAR